MIAALELDGRFSRAGRAIAYLAVTLPVTLLALPAVLALTLGAALSVAGIGLPLLVKLHGAQPATLGAMGMLTGYCGTLITPMAANFNIVPVVLLELRDPHAVIRAQWPTALALLVANLILMSVFVFR